MNSKHEIVRDLDARACAEGNCDLRAGMHVVASNIHLRNPSRSGTSIAGELDRRQLRIPSISLDFPRFPYISLYFPLFPSIFTFAAVARLVSRPRAGSESMERAAVFLNFAMRNSWAG